MNAPERFEMFLLPDGARKIEITKDPKMPNCLLFKIQREDHTIANILRYKLLKHPQVLFSAYRAPHPLEYYVELKVQTTSRTTPINVMLEAIQSLMLEYGNIRSAFDNELFRLEPTAADGSRRAARAPSTYGGFGSIDASVSEFGISSDISSTRGDRADDVDIDF
ncbi:DNA-directed RNA polymerase II core subunit [Coemansia spiralis]|uniref:DNA-directed RNA polymerase II core subunit n=2 Tax=Coemansia TaxID=4863 RepID=A0A9W8G7T3_9FUNG|nr:DNA-directed RNA polymerase [Coemansia spiralis]KAJ1993472.1 DNA-directed RNA polymerase II core subunit [Coemansia umbellata]KAJ2625286.1 DNA-directed RNA polymerase II core subunit [Coemansia sp. RSA 1358]KAJ2677992.1 DNA-directed RNA polymerase II core subunit [Coemansia spiralis]